MDAASRPQELTTPAGQRAKVPAPSSRSIDVRLARRLLLPLHIRLLGSLAGPPPTISVVFPDAPPVAFLSTPLWTLPVLVLWAGSIH